MDIYFKELVKETDSEYSTLRVDGFLTKIQKAIHKVLQPLIQLWASAAKQRDELLTGDLPKDEAGWKAVVSLVGQASQRTSYYRRHLILESHLSD